MEILVTLSHISPSVNPTKSRLSTLVSPTKLHMMSTNSQREAKEIKYEDVSLDEVIELPKFDLSTITLEKCRFYKRL